MKSIFKILTVSLFLISCSQSGKKAGRYYDDDNMMLVDGKRTFIIGSYHLPKTDDPYAELSRNGYNYAHAGFDKVQLDNAEKNGLKVWLSTGAIDEKDSVKSKAKISEQVQKYKDHPALLIWEIADEPAFTWNSAEARVSPQKMERTYDLIKSIDDSHAVFTNHAPVNLISTMKKYNPSQDVVGVDVYPVIPHGIVPSYAIWPDGLQGDLLNPYISQVGEYVDKMKKVVNDSKPVFAVLQGFSWEMLKPEAKRDTAMILYPTHEQLRFMAYDAIVHGANGILIWGTNYTPQPSKFMNDLNRVTHELAEMQDVLSARTITNSIKKEYIETGHSVDAGVEFITKKVNGKTYLLSVNSDKNPVKVTFSGLGSFKLAKVLKEGRAVKIENGEFSEKYAPFDVHVYEFAE